MKTVHLLIKGNVQGVFYRASARTVAGKLKLCGWIKNTASGDVEAIVSGTANNVDEFITWSKNGPDKAEVNEVVITETEFKMYDSFLILR